MKLLDIGLCCVSPGGSDNSLELVFVVHYQPVSFLDNL